MTSHRSTFSRSSFRYFYLQNQHLFLRNFYFVFMNKHKIIQVSLCHLLQTVSISPFGNFLQQKPAQHGNQANANKLTDLYTI